MDKRKYYESPAMTVIATETTCLLAGSSDENGYSIEADERDGYNQIEKVVWD